MTALQPPPRVLAIQHIDCEPPGLIADVLTESGISVDIIRPDLGHRVPANVAELDGLVVMGGPMGVYEVGQYPYLRDELHVIESALARRCPILGVCLGSQLLASVLGAPVAPAGFTEIGWMPVHWDAAAADDTLFREVAGAPCTVLHWHGDAYPLPTGAVSLAHSARTACQAFRYGAEAYGVLFHMEADPSQVTRMTSTFADELAAIPVDIAGLHADTVQYSPAATNAARHVFGAWTSLVRTRAAEQS